MSIAVPAVADIMPEKQLFWITIAWAEELGGRHTTPLQLLELHLRPYWYTDRLLSLKDALFSQPPDFMQLEQQAASTVVVDLTSLILEDISQLDLTIAENADKIDVDLHEAKESVVMEPKISQRVPPSVAENRERDSLEEFMKLRGKAVRREIADPVSAFSKTKLTIPSTFCSFLPFHVALANVSTSRNTLLLVPPSVPFLSIPSILVHNFLNLSPTIRVLWVFESEPTAAVPFFQRLLAQVGEQALIITGQQQFSTAAAGRPRVVMASAKSVELQLFADSSALSPFGLVFFEPLKLDPSSACSVASKALLSSHKPRVVVIVGNGSIPPSSSSAWLQQVLGAFGVE
jgi:hypothetical protein